MANCKFCGKEIVWMKEGRKNVPVEVDGAAHECEQFKSSRQSIRTVDLDEMSEEEMKKIYEGLKKNSARTAKIKKRNQNR